MSTPAASRETCPETSTTDREPASPGRSCPNPSHRPAHRVLPGPRATAFALLALIFSFSPHPAHAALDASTTMTLGMSTALTGPAGMDDYLAKPFRREELCRIVTQWSKQPPVPTP